MIFRNMFSPGSLKREFCSLFFSCQLYQKEVHKYTNTYIKLTFIQVNLHLFCTTGGIFLLYVNIYVMRVKLTNCFEHVTD